MMAGKLFPSSTKGGIFVLQGLRLFAALAAVYNALWLALEAVHGVLWLNWSWSARSTFVVLFGSFALITRDSKLRNWDLNHMLRVAGIGWLLQASLFAYVVFVSTQADALTTGGANVSGLVLTMLAFSLLSRWPPVTVVATLCLTVAGYILVGGVMNDTTSFTGMSGLLALCAAATAGIYGAAGLLQHLSVCTGSDERIYDHLFQRSDTTFSFFRNQVGPLVYPIIVALMVAGLQHVLDW